ncbi:ABC transporter substrate-binding protein (plasmid) [Agrobacterium tumefaciens]|uniref:ABC transporter substrate-binding protein n=1 Tax=Agrobacterium tumefaciens TaxID=358 RepID=A0AAJ4N8A0_AGRTU|nr:ABC transporter substrate-binding protein [Agrobacterium tumefaciens]
MNKRFAFAFLAALTVTGGVAAQEKVKVGMVLTLSGPPAAVGQQVRNGFDMALEELGGKLGGLPAELTVQDDELKPDIAVTKAQALVQRDGVQFVVGPVFSNVLQAIIKPVTDSNVFLLSPNPGTSDFAGVRCNPNFFVLSIQNDQGAEAVGEYATREKLKNIVALAPNYQAGRDMIAGFKNAFKDELADEIFVPLNQLDYSAEMARIASLQPDAVFAFMPGGMGVNFVKQFDQAGLKGKVKMLSVFSADEVNLTAQQDAALGVLSGSSWAPTLDNPANHKFVDAYIKKFKAVPATYAAFAYDSAMLIDAAVRSVGGNLDDKDALRKALQTSEFKSLRGPFKFNSNHYPIQNVYLTEVQKRQDGLYQSAIVQTVLENNADRYSQLCAMK